MHLSQKSFKFTSKPNNNKNPSEMRQKSPIHTRSTRSATAKREHKKKEKKASKETKNRKKFNRKQSSKPRITSSYQISARNPLLKPENDGKMDQ